MSDPVEFTLETPLRRRKRRTRGRFFLAKGEFTKPTNQEVQNGERHQ